MLVEPADMLHASPLPGWSGSFFHSDHLTFALWDVAEGAAPLHEHHHEQEEVWNVVEGEIALTVGGVEHVVRAGCAVVVPPDVPHAARPLGPCRAIVTDWPVRRSLPGVSHT